MQDRTGRTGQAEQERKTVQAERTGRQDMQNRTGRAGQAKQERKKVIVREQVQ